MTEDQILYRGNGAVIEPIGHGFCMRLELSERDGNLVFTSTRYDVTIGGWTIRIPTLLTPGITTVTHEQISGARFRFSLAVVHPLLGRTIYQVGEFRDVGFTSAPARPKHDAADAKV